LQYCSDEDLIKDEYYLIRMGNKNTALWLIIAVALGLFAYSLVSILVNGFQMYELYALILGAVNLIAVYLLKK